jgi:hypothetical protein
MLRPGRLSPEIACAVCHRPLELVAGPGDTIRCSVLYKNLALVDSRPYLTIDLHAA